VVGKGTQDGALIIDVRDSDTDHLKLMALGAHLVEEFPNVSVPGALHVDEHLVEVSLGMFTLGREMLLDIIPVFLSRSESHDIEGDLLGDVLIQKIIHDLVLASPLPDHLHFLVSGIM